MIANKNTIIVNKNEEGRFLFDCQKKLSFCMLEALDLFMAILFCEQIRERQRKSAC
jgi:hypothetical protein